MESKNINDTAPINLENDLPPVINCLNNDDSSNSSYASIINDHSVLDKYGIIDFRDKMDNYSNLFLSQPHSHGKSTKHSHVITINSGKSIYFLSTSLEFLMI